MHACSLGCGRPAYPAEAKKSLRGRKGSWGRYHRGYLFCVTSDGQDRDASSPPMRPEDRRGPRLVPLWERQLTGGPSFQGDQGFPRPGPGRGPGAYVEAAHPAVGKSDLNSTTPPGRCLRCHPDVAFSSLAFARPGHARSGRRRPCRREGTHPRIPPRRGTRGCRFPPSRVGASTQTRGVARRA